MTAAACATRFASPTRSNRGDHLGKRRRHGESHDFRSVSESSRQLFEEQWHTVGTLHERVADLRLQLRHLREPLEHPTRFVAAQPVECDLRVRTQVRVVGDLWSGAHQYQNRRAPASDHVHRFQRAGVRPVCVLDHQQDRPRACQILDPGSGFLRGGGDVTHHLTERLERAQRAAATTEDRGDGAPLLGQFGTELEEESRFPYAGLAQHEHEAPGPVLDAAPVLLEPGRCVGTGYECGEWPRLQPMPCATALQDTVGRHRMPDPFQRQGAE